MKTGTVSPSFTGIMGRVLLKVLVVFVLLALAVALPARRNYDKRFGCYRLNCPEGQTCKENHYGEGYCLDNDNPIFGGAVRDTIQDEGDFKSLDVKNALHTRKRTS
ncbi:uncharacterized protein [Ptychodera flava]|uniref:uncharacterized protein n=1 Tax=Ptychodera flava TaxID=63121 RepID=UPI00396A209B